MGQDERNRYEGLDRDAVIAAMREDLAKLPDRDLRHISGHLDIVLWCTEHAEELEAQNREEEKGREQRRIDTEREEQQRAERQAEETRLRAEWATTKDEQIAAVRSRFAVMPACSDEPLRVFHVWYGEHGSVEGVGATPEEAWTNAVEDTITYYGEAMTDPKAAAPDAGLAEWVEDLTRGYLGAAFLPATKALCTLDNGGPNAAGLEGMVARLPGVKPPSPVTPGEGRAQEQAEHQATKAPTEAELQARRAEYEAIKAKGRARQATWAKTKDEEIAAARAKYAKRLDFAPPSRPLHLLIDSDGVPSGIGDTPDEAFNDAIENEIGLHDMLVADGECEETLDERMGRMIAGYRAVVLVVPASERMWEIGRIVERRQRVERYEHPTAPPAAGSQVEEGVVAK